MSRAVAAFALALTQFVPTALPPTWDQAFNLFATYLESLRAQAHIPGLAAAVISDDGIVWEGAYGFQDLEHGAQTRLATPFHIDGLTEVFTTALVLRCVEEGKLSLNARIGDYDPKAPDGSLTIAQVLTHTSGPVQNPTFAYRPAAASSLASVVGSCADHSYRRGIADLFEQNAMIDSVPGPDVLTADTAADGLDAATIDGYRDTLTKLATAYAVSRSGQASRSQSNVTALTAATGLISTIQDYAEFDKALRNGPLLLPETLDAAWTPPTDRDGHPLPHGMGWFVQDYNGERVVWQFGVDDNAYSSLVITVPGRRFTVILLANSDGLVRPSPLDKGDLTVSPFGRFVLALLVK